MMHSLRISSHLNTIDPSLTRLYSSVGHKYVPTSPLPENLHGYCNQELKVLRKVWDDNFLGAMMGSGLYSGDITDSAMPLFLRQQLEL